MLEIRRFSEHAAILVITYVLRVRAKWTTVACQCHIKSNFFHHSVQFNSVWLFSFVFVETPTTHWTFSVLALHFQSHTQLCIDSLSFMTHSATFSHANGMSLFATVERNCTNSLDVTCCYQLLKIAATMNNKLWTEYKKSEVFSFPALLRFQERHYEMEFLKNNPYLFQIFLRIVCFHFGTESVATTPTYLRVVKQHRSAHPFWGPWGF